ncbi:hypothetical protein [Methylobacterium sp. SyP6R]|uniref:hypothetical protein n=1 Tax=Methylobacterium sp. SyP6R TaxID=2718876 RepID=UPI001F2C787D|nr:hypothetical protein [Methylobacterium sp. SyP6R]MCF4130250.1 hypothetical protein [Methylobacterium sp. SyP6R]
MERKKPTGLIEQHAATGRHPLDVVSGVSGAAAGGAGVLVTALNAALLETPAAPAVIVFDVIVAAGGLSTRVAKAIVGSMSMAPQKYGELSEKVEAVSRLFEPRQTAADYISEKAGSLLPSYLENEFALMDRAREAARIAREVSEGKVKLDEFLKLTEGIKAAAELVNKAAHEVELQRKEAQASAERERAARDQMERVRANERDRDLKQAAERQQAEIEKENREIKDAIEKQSSSNRYDYRDNQIGQDNSHSVTV